MDMDAAVGVSNDNNGFGKNHGECGQSTSGKALRASKSILKKKTLIANDKDASSNDLNTDHPILIDDEPLNLTIINCDEPLDLSIKNPK